jgi:hypothetical protein
MNGPRARLAFAVLVALALGPALAVAPPLAGVAAAADELRLEAAATYAVDPGARVIHVSVSVAATNLKPDVPIAGGGTTIFWYRDLRLPIHTDATALQAADSVGSLRVSRAADVGVDVATVRLRVNLYSGQTTQFTLRYDLPGGAPRSASEIRVGQAFIGLVAFAWGSPGLGSVRIEMPAGYTTSVIGEPLDRTVAGQLIVLTATAIDDPDAWWSVVSADRESKLATSRLALGDGNTIVVRAWPEDPEWQTRTVDTLRTGVPLLRRIVGLDWPVDGQLVVTEVQASALEGYAGLYDPATHTIRVTEDLDGLTILHEASHSWFNDDLFDSRWIDEGLANGYASLVLGEIGTESFDPPTVPTASDPGRVALNDWQFPGRIADDATEARETYGYNASWYVTQELIDDVGEAGMRNVLRSADGDRIAYVGAAAPEAVPARDGWQRFLDLLDEVGGSKVADTLFRSYVVPPAGVSTLDERAAARADYAGLAIAGAGWRPPLVVRRAMSDWRFDDAEGLIDEATAILAERDRLGAAATGLGLDVPGDLAHAWDASETSLQPAEDAGTAIDAALDDLTGARAALDAKRDLFVSVGLLGATPEAGWDAAAADFEAGDLAAADAATDGVVALLDRAGEAGRLRIGGAVGGLGGGLAIVALVVRRRRRLAPAAGAVTTTTIMPPTAAEPAPPSPDPAEPYATLPAAAPDETADPPPDRATEA